MTAARLRLLSMAVILVEAGVVALAQSQTWYLLRLSGAEYAVGGDVAAGVLLPLALASLTVVPALALAGPVFRVILGVLDALLGVCVVVVVAWSLGDPVRASLPVLADATGFTADEQAWLDQIASTVTTAWPFVALVTGVLMILTGIGVALTSRAWPASGSRYSRTRFAGQDRDATQDWDALSDGEDPTEPGR